MMQRRISLGEITPLLRFFGGATYDVALFVVCWLCAPTLYAADFAHEVNGSCLDVLREGVRSDEFWPSIHAAEALTLAGHGEEVRELLEPKLKTETDDQKRCGLSRELVRAGDHSKAAVMLRILAGDDEYGHVHAAESLYKVWEIGDGVAMRRAMAQTKNANLRLMAAGALARCGNPAALKLLRELIGDDDPEVRRLTAWLLARIGDSSDIRALRDGLNQADTDFARCYFEHALAMLGDEVGLKTLASNLDHDDPTVRVYAAVFAGEARATSLTPRLIQMLDDPTLDVRIRAAQSILVMSQAKPIDDDDEIVSDVFLATDDNPRYSEGSIIALKDGSLLYATTEFIKGGSDFSSAQIVARVSMDDGRTWSEQRILQKNVGKKNVMSATLRRLSLPAGEDGSIGMFYLVKNGYDDLDVFLRVSHDEANSFGDPVLVSDKPGYHVMNNDRVTALSSGRLLVPVASTADVQQVNHFVSHCFLSDDGGKTWRDSRESIDLPQRGAMEPEVFETADGRVGMILRTQLGYIAVSYSADGGDTWSKPTSLGVTAPEAPSTLRRVPATGDLLLVFNDNYEAGAGHGGKRTPLTLAVSGDDGKTWSSRQDIEDRSDQTYAYTSLTFVGHRAVMSYYVEEKGRISSRFRSIPVRSLYEEQ